MVHARLTATHDPTKVGVPDGWRLVAFETIDSTNAASRRMIEAGLDVADGSVLWAREQTAGRGRSGRPWLGSPGNMFVSVILAAPGEIARAPQLGFVAALAAIDAVQSLAPDRASDDAVKCKWPNDILLDGAKVGGILLETATGARADAWVVVGIGLNVNPVEVPDAQYPVTSLAEHGIAVGVPRLLDTFLRAFQARVARWRRDGFEPTRGEWTAHAARLGERLTVATGSGEVHGRFVGIDADGALLLERAGGAKRDRVLAGDVLR